MYVCVVKELLTAAYTTSSLPSEVNVSTQDVKSSLYITVNSQHVVNRVVNRSEVMQGRSPTAGPENDESCDHTEAVRTSDSLLSGRHISEYEMHTPRSLISVPFSSTTRYLIINENTNMSDLPVVVLSDNVGYVTSPGFDDNKKYPNNYDGAFKLNVPNESVLINFVTRHFAMDPGDYLDMYDVDANDYLDMYIMTIKQWGRLMAFKVNIEAKVFRDLLHIIFHSDSSFTEWGFKMMFVILPRSQEPERLPNKFFNCSVPNFHNFRPVFNCTFLAECEGGEDERDCGHRKNDCGIKDAIDTGTKCYTLVHNQRTISWFEAHRDCIRRGQKLAMFKDPEEFIQFKALVPPVVNERGYFVGARLKERRQAVSTSALYGNIWQWVDGSTIFSVQISTVNSVSFYCSRYYPWLPQLVSVPCFENKKGSAFTCEFSKDNDYLNNPTLTLEVNSIYVNSTSVFWRVHIIQCQLGHITRDFLSCDYDADCDASHSVTSCAGGVVTVPMFLCQASRSTVHYTLVCDHMQHCSDDSDEDFCKHPECPPTFIKCTNSQCIHFSQQCDGNLDCYDGSDEDCPSQRYTIVTTLPPGSIYLDGKGNFWLDRMNNTDHCPQTHFLCPRGFCLPVYLRCNGINDCFSGEDEFGCDTYKCCGHYRCRGSKVCLHADNVCDGVPQCPEQDDEMLCDFILCPDGCRCQSLAFVCTSNFSAILYDSLRYLDAGGSNMTLTDVSNKTYLIALRLSMCHIGNITQSMTFPNLRELDLSWNKLHRVHMQYFHSLENLRVLVLTGNPLIKIINSKISGVVIIKLERLDISYTNLEEISGIEFAETPNIRVLNISWSKLRSIPDDSFQFIPRLENLDMRGFHLRNIPKNLLRNLQFLKIIHAENYKICCESLLPVNFDFKNCHSTRDLLASCDDLLKSSTYRIFLWVFVLLSFVGNVFSIGARLYRQQEGSFGVFVTNLSVADLFMGVYLIIIGSADLVYRGRYLWRDDEWKTSVACNIAGFLCLLSSETSAFIICLITLDRFLVLQFPFGRLHFRRRSAIFASGTVWAVGFSLAMIPLLPMTSHWEFYSQTGICIPLPFTSSNVFHGYDYSFVVSILLNLVLFLLIAVGQAVVYWAVRSNSMPSSTNTQTRDAAIARRLLTVVVSDFLCWFPIGFLGLLAFTGTPIPGDLNVAVATFVLPVNSALNPFLYTFNLLMEKRRKSQNEKLLKRLELQIRGQTTEVKSKSRQVPAPVDKNAVIQQIQAWIIERVLTSEDLLLCSANQKLS